MKQVQKKSVNLFLTIISLICVALLFSGCGGGGDDAPILSAPPANTSTVSGTAAAGAPIVGTVNVRGADGNLSFSAIESDGSFTVDVSVLTAPFVVWAEGTSSGKSVNLYSTITEPGKVNVTPATNIIMAMALGDDPESYYSQNPDAAAPDNSDIESSKAVMLELLESVFATLDMPADFDLMNGEFVADGTKFDKILDTVEMTASQDDTVEIEDKATGTILYEKDLDTGVETTKLTPDEIDDIVNDSMATADTIKEILKKIEPLYASGVSSLADLQSDLRPFMADDYLDEGYGPDDMIESWADSSSDNGPMPGVTIDNVVIHRKMGSLTFGSQNPWTIDEYDTATYTDGVWCIFTVSFSNFSFSEQILTSFVKTASGVWKWYGNRCPFLHGGEIRSRANRHIYSDGIEKIHSGIELWAEDEGNLALSNFGMDMFMVINNGLPEWTAYGDTYNTLILNKMDQVSTQYVLSNVDTPEWGSMYVEEAGLNISKLTDPEYVFVGFASGNPPVPKHVWIDLLGAPPIKAAELSADDFPVITSPSTHNIQDLNIPGSVTISWVNPEGKYADWMNIWWNDNNNNWTNMEKDNPAEFNTDLSQENWTSETFDTSNTTVYPPNYANIHVFAEDDASERGFVTVWEMD